LNWTSDPKTGLLNLYLENDGAEKNASLVDAVELQRARLIPASIPVNENRNTADPTYARPTALSERTSVPYHEDNPNPSSLAHTWGVKMPRRRNAWKFPPDSKTDTQPPTN
jgi:hypothetical protein